MLSHISCISYKQQIIMAIFACILAAKYSAFPTHYSVTLPTDQFNTVSTQTQKLGYL